MNKSIPLSIDCICGSNLVLAKITTDVDVDLLGFISVQIDKVRVICSECRGYANNCQDDFTKITL